MKCTITFEGDYYEEKDFFTTALNARTLLSKLHEADCLVRRRLKNAEVEDEEQFLQELLNELYIGDLD